MQVRLLRNQIILRDLIGPHETLMSILQLTDGDNYHGYLRIDNSFYNIYSPESPTISCRGKSLSIFFRFWSYLPHNTLFVLICHVCQATVGKFVPDVLMTPSNKYSWNQVAEKLSQRMWQFNHTIGAMDGQNVAIRQPPHAGSTVYIYNKFTLRTNNNKFIHHDVNGSCYYKRLLYEMVHWDFLHQNYFQMIM